ncbi:hypothetical protein [Magnetospira sp. QH-2]|uniref:hypothetical protein n=1 Tax=Magnetospira sp. (strain QH-2) TaxID=1288970 RepID=UPI0003E81237|nr:hypothetical protein [Magnetospira sp. QH-2]CCQ73174.1 Conserved exported protein of unknown function [Magnetospira sp. QH-2]
MIRFIALSATLFVAATAPAWAAPTVIDLTQVPCQFLDLEPDHGFKSTKKADCLAINAQGATDRMAAVKPMALKPGEYIFRVKNGNVPYELGFWLRDKDYDWRNPLHKLSKTSVSGGGLTPGTTKDYKVSLKPGDYLFSCPLNPTPDYPLIVRE